MTDEEFMRRAIEVARRAGEKGNPPFGSILVDANGEVVLEGENNMATESDCTGHAEINLIRDASRRFGVGQLGDYTMFTSAEPCCMCTAAAFWGGLGRIVFGLSSGRLAEIRGKDGPPALKLPCREVLAHGQRDIQVTGPLLEDEAATLFGAG